MSNFCLSHFCHSHIISLPIITYHLAESTSTSGGEGETIKCGVSSNLLALYFLKRKEDDELEKKLNVDSSQMKSFWACLF